MSETSDEYTDENRSPDATQPSVSDPQLEDIKKLEKEAKDYGALWPAFLIIGLTFTILGFQGNTTFYIIGFVFIALGASWSAISSEAKKKLSKIQTEEKENG